MSTRFVEPKTLGQLATMVNGRVNGDPSYQLTGVATLSAATNADISFLANSAYKPQLETTQAGAVILSEEDLPTCAGHALVTSNPYASYAKIAHLCIHTPKHNEGNIALTAVVDKTAQVHPSAILNDYVVVGAHAKVGAGTIIHSGTVVGENAHIGDNCLIYPHVTLYHGVVLGNRVTIHANTVVGSDGFGFAFDKNNWVKVPQLGTVRIADDVEIGSHTTIDRGAIDDTVIEQGAKIDNQVQIGHNVVIGAYTVVAGTAAFAGSAKIGRYCLIGGGATFAGHITVCDQVQIAGMTTVTRSISKPGIYSSGTGMMPAAQWRKSVVHFRNLDEIVKRVRKLEEQLSDE